MLHTKTNITHKVDTTRNVGEAIGVEVVRGVEK